MTAESNEKECFAGFSSPTKASKFLSRARDEGNEISMSRIGGRRICTYVRTATTNAAGTSSAECGARCKNQASRSAQSCQGSDRKN